MQTHTRPTRQPFVTEARSQSTPDRRRTLLVFHLSGQTYALPLHAVQEVLPLAALSRPPAAPSLLAGFLNLGGTAVPVVRLDRLFAVPELTAGRYTPLLLLRNAEYPLALMVERVSRILTVSEQAVLAVPAHQTFNDCVEGVVTLDDHVLLLLSAERILLEKEHHCLAELQDWEQSRLRALEGQPL